MHAQNNTFYKKCIIILQCNTGQTARASHWFSWNIFHRLSCSVRNGETATVSNFLLQGVSIIWHRTATITMNNQRYSEPICTDQLTGQTAVAIAYLQRRRARLISWQLTARRSSFKICCSSSWTEKGINPEQRHNCISPEHIVRQQGKFIQQTFWYAPLFTSGVEAR